jgi:hypothetical protein
MTVAATVIVFGNTDNFVVPARTQGKLHPTLFFAREHIDFYGTHRT